MPQAKVRHITYFFWLQRAVMKQTFLPLLENIILHKLAQLVNKTGVNLKKNQPSLLKKSTVKVLPFSCNSTYCQLVAVR